MAHPDAFRFFRYETESGQREGVWNATERAVPDRIVEARSGEFARCIGSAEVVDYIPWFGERIFVVPTEVRMRAECEHFLMWTECNDRQRFQRMQREYVSRADAISGGVEIMVRCQRVLLVTVGSALMEAYAARFRPEKRDYESNRHNQ